MGAIPRRFESCLLRQVMRIIFLNSLFGKIGKKYFDYIKKESKNTDIFCFMEYTPEVFTQTSAILKDYAGFLEKGHKLSFADFRNILDCQVIFVRNNVELLSSGKLNLNNLDKNDTGFASYVVIKYKSKEICVVNVHGKAYPGDKNDTPARLKQTQKILNFCKKFKYTKIIGGDFNLNPDTRSVKMFEEAGYRNLIKDFEIKNTRNRISWKTFKNVQHFADYCFVSPEVKVKSFDVPYMEVSDHLPLILDFEV